MPVETGPTLIMVCGILGAGTSVHGSSWLRSWGAIRLSPDEWRSLSESLDRSGLCALPKTALRNK
jgi:predicted kinase